MGRCHLVQWRREESSEEKNLHADASFKNFFVDVHVLDEDRSELI